jgi:hypothetical protein
MVPVLQGELEFSFALILNSAMHIILTLSLLLSWQDCIGTIDGTHVTARVPRSQSAAYRGRKHYISQNVLATVDFDLKFTYILAGWEGSAHDASWGWQFYPWVWVPAGTVPTWAGYGNIFVPMGNTHTLPIKSWVGYGYSLVPVDIPIPYPFIVICESMWNYHHMTRQLLLTYLISMRDIVISKSW